MNADEWNTAHGVGTIIVLRLGNDKELLATTGGLARPAGELVMVPIAPSGSLWPLDRVRLARIGDTNLGWFW